MTPHIARGTANLLNWLAVFVIIVVDAKLKNAWKAKTDWNNGFAPSLLQSVVHVVVVGRESLQAEIVGAFGLQTTKAFGVLDVKTQF